jgi:hypothetical protein
LVNSKSKSVKVFRKIVWVSIPSNFFDKVFDGGLHGQRTLSKKTLTKFLNQSKHLSNQDLCKQKHMSLKNGEAKFDRVNAFRYL